MGLSVGPQSFSPLPGELRGTDAKPQQGWGEGSLDPLIAALGRAVERSQTKRPDVPREERD